MHGPCYISILQAILSVPNLSMCEHCITFISVVVLAEDITIQNKLAEHGVLVQTVPEVAPIHVYPARVLSQIYSLLGKK